MRFILQAGLFLVICAPLNARADGPAKWVGEVVVSTQALTGVRIRINNDPRFSSVRYDATSNRWLAQTGDPVNFAPVRIGAQKEIPAYLEDEDPVCRATYYVLTDRQFAFAVSGPCRGPKLRDFVASYRIPDGVKVLATETDPKWKTVRRPVSHSR